MPSGAPTQASLVLMIMCPPVPPHTVWACCWQRVRKVTELGNICVPSDFTSPVFIPWTCLPEQEPLGPGYKQGWASVLFLLLHVPQTRGGDGGSLLASFLVRQLNDSFSAFLFCLLRASSVVLGRIEGPDSRGWLVPAPGGGRLTISGCPCASFDYSHAAFTVYICFIVHRFVNIIA